MDILCLLMSSLNLCSVICIHTNSRNFAVASELHTLQVFFLAKSTERELRIVQLRPKYHTILSRLSIA